MVRLVCCSIFAKLSKDKRIRSSYFGKRFAQAFVDFNAFSTHVSLLPLATISASNSSFGIPAISTNTFCSWRSSARTRFIIFFIDKTSTSNCFGTKRNCLKISASWAIWSFARLPLRPCFAIVANVLVCCSLKAANLSRATSGSMLLSESLSSELELLSFSSSSSLSSSTSTADSALSSSSAKCSSIFAVSSSAIFGSTKPVIKSAKR